MDGIVTESAFDEARRLALDRNGVDGPRLAAIGTLAAFRTRGAAEALLELGSRDDEPEVVLRAAGGP
jgi:hypothetical protein